MELFSKQVDIIGAGAVLVDDLAVPYPDEKIEIIQSQKQLGGPVPTALRTLSELGLTCSIIGKVADDSNSRFIIDNLKKNNINTKNIIIQKNAQSGYSQIWIDLRNKTCTIAYSSGSLSDYKTEEINLKSLQNAKLLHIDGRNHDAAIDLIKYYKNKDTLISIDTGNFRKKTLNLLELTDIIIMPKRFAVNLLNLDKELSILTEKISDIYPAKKAIIITDGINGSACWHKEKIYTQKAFKAKVFNTTGAGDVHAAGVIYGIVNNWNMPKILKFAAATTALKCQTLGNIELPEYNQVIKFIQKSNNKSEDSSYLITAGTNNLSPHFK